MKKLPTDLQILNKIYELYYDVFAQFPDIKKNRKEKIYVPIDIKEIADDLQVDGDIVFGRLYYHLNGKYWYKQTNGSRVSFFELKIGEDKHCINFPFMASVLAELRDRARKHNIATWIAFGSLVISIIAIIISILGSQST